MYGLKIKVQTSAVHVIWYHPKVQLTLENSYDW